MNKYKQSTYHFASDGQEIFEGDIIEYLVASNDNVNRLLLQVVFSSSRRRFVLKPINNLNSPFQSDLDMQGVILYVRGNIHDLDFAQLADLKSKYEFTKRN